jgi:sulfonate transport system permease protein
MRVSRKSLRGAVLPLVLLGLWSASLHFGWLDRKLFVPPQQVLETAWHMLGSGELWIDLGASLARDAAGFALGAAAGLVVGVVLGASRLAEYLVGPTFHTVKQVSLFAWIPLISLWFGLGDAAKVAFLSLSAFFPVVLNTMEGIRNVSAQYIEVGTLYGFSYRQQLVRILLPAALPSIFTGVHLALIYAWLGTLGAEYLMTSGNGIGNLLTDGRENFWMDRVILGVVLAGVIGFAMTMLATFVEKRLMRWRPAHIGTD